MPVQRYYTAAEVKSAIDVANAQYYRKLLRVRNDLTDRQLDKAKVKVARDPGGQALNPHEWRGRGSDVGHAFRHVDGTAPTGKSIYRDETTAVAVTLELLNSPKGQAALGRLDGDNPDGDELGMEANRRIVAPVTAARYGAAGTGQSWKKIATAVCEVMKLGEDTLWIHSTYPSSFHS